MSAPAAVRLDAPDCWAGCYDIGWLGEIIPEAFAHPAKIGRGLVRKIYAHAFAEGWLRAGDLVIDPFGGIGGTAIDAALRGVRWIGNELEPKFVALGNQNIELWQRKYSGLNGWVRPTLLQGDSRRLAQNLGRAEMVCGSPPYAVGVVVDRNGIDRSKMADGRPGGPNSQAGVKGYGMSDGQLGAMKEGDPPVLVVGSPPYAEIASGAGGLNTKPPKHEGQQGGRASGSASQDTDQRYGDSEGQLARMVLGSPPFSHPNEQPVASQSRLLKEGGYAAIKAPGKMARGTTDGNLESMREGDAAAVIGSPPFNENRSNQIHGNAKGVHSYDENEAKSRAKKNYQKPEHPDNLGLSIDTTFWEAAAEIVAQCHLILRPGGHAVWVTKDFVRKGKRVPFSDQWQALCESQGFRLVCRHRAMLVAHHGEQRTIFGDTEVATTSRKSFFRRLAEAKGSPPIDWEDVICLEKIA